jgi:hypothetical protein
MVRPASLARRYRINARGDCGGLLASVADNVQAGVAPKTQLAAGWLGGCRSGLYTG